MVQFYKAPKSSAHSKKANQKKRGKGASLPSLSPRDKEDRLSAKQNGPFAPHVIVSIDVLDQHGKGVCLSTDPITIVSDALPGEQIKVQVNKSTKRVNFASPVKVLEASAHRQRPFCEVYEKCGGCSLQICSAKHGLSLKEDALKRYFEKEIGISHNVWSEPVLAEINYEQSQAEAGYRRKVRFAIDARNRDKPKIGYRQAKSNQVVDIKTCPILAPALEKKVEACLTKLKQQSWVKDLGQLEFTQSSDGCVASLLFVNVPSARSLSHIAKLSKELEIRVIAMHKGRCIEDHGQAFASLLIEDLKGLRLHFGVEDFIQVNRSVNNRMITQALAWLSLDKSQRVHDFFCGLGNFSLALANHSAKVSAYEVDANMVNKARQNARENALSNIDFVEINLSNQEALKQLTLQTDDAVLLDPSREGALPLCEYLVGNVVKRIVYVSCNPNSLLRDLKVLKAQYTVQKIGVLDMFPFTQHLECMVLLQRK